MTHHNNVEPPPPGVVVRETPWAPGGRTSGRSASGKTRPRTSSLSQLEAPIDPALEVFETHALNRAFERLMDELQIPAATRIKMATLEPPVKAAMLKSSHVLNLDAPLDPPPPLQQSGHLRKSHSSTSMVDGRPEHSRSSSLGSNAGIPVMDEMLDRANAPWMRDEYASSGSSLGRPSSPGPFNSASSSISSAAQNRQKPLKEKDLDKSITPAAFAQMLQKTVCTQLDVERLKKLRRMLRNESAGWTEMFVRERGYSALLSRLTDMLNVEWREEQRDDKILHELLRCIKALATSEIGCFALRTSCPTPWNQLIVLLYSDKKPGDVATRREMMDLMLILFEIFPSANAASPRPSLSPVPTISSGIPRPRSATPPPSSPSIPHALPAPHTSLYTLIRTMLLVAAPRPAEQDSEPVQPHTFIESIRTPRIYKTYLQELSDVCRDYFWVFCHPQNTIWSLRDTDVKRVEMPRAPGGMTGGVEYEAVGYMTSHLKFINSLAVAAAELNLPNNDELSARGFHSDLFASGIERILATTRKASTTYYPTLHLEIARYISHAASSGFELPWSLARYVGLPPSHVLLAGTLDNVGGSSKGAKITLTPSSGKTPPASPSKRGAFTQAQMMAAPKGLAGSAARSGGAPLVPMKPSVPLK
ncbi:hypothetical protein DL93DRAFT_2058914 [Clavulina sp. PMI_390]|nr:hypothetical protein DL93DRAFT_2058914 [Clavulina sp. PMI_390]